MRITALVKCIEAHTHCAVHIVYSTAHTSEDVLSSHLLYIVCLPHGDVQVKLENRAALYISPHTVYNGREEHTDAL